MGWGARVGAWRGWCMEVVLGAGLMYSAGWVRGGSSGCREGCRMHGGGGEQGTGCREGVCGEHAGLREGCRRGAGLREGCREGVWGEGVVQGAGRGAEGLQRPLMSPPRAAPRAPTRWCWVSTTWVPGRAWSSAFPWPPSTSSSTPNGEAPAWPAGEQGPGVGGDWGQRPPQRPRDTSPRAAAMTSP